MPSKIVDADNERTVNINERIDKGNALAEMFKAMPWFVWATPGWLLLGLIFLAIGHDGIGGFTNHVMGWLALVPWAVGILCGVKAFVWVTGTYNRLRVDTYNRRLLAENVNKARQAVIAAEKKNTLLDADIEMAYQMPNIILMLSQQGTAFEYTKGGNLKVLGLPGAGARVSEVPNQQGQLGAAAAPLALGAGGALPTKVLYEEIKEQVPQGRVLVGVGVTGIETKEAAVGACVWIVGLSGTGKTSTTVIRVEERANEGHKFLGVDPHWFKDDSLYHSIYELIDKDTGAVIGPGAYKDLFLMPIARDTAESKKVLQAFLDEFYARKAGRVPKPWQKITLLVDELGALVDTTCEEEEEVKAMLKTISRICGQEARNFGMGGIFISQQATELAWLRKVALMVIVHQLLQDSEKKLATNNDRVVMDDMKTWPIGRTYVFGVGFGQEGPRTVQQPYFAGRRVNGAAPTGNGAELHHDEMNESNTVDAAASAPAQDERIVPALAGDLRAVYDACQQLIQAGQPISSRAVAGLLPDFGKDKCNNLLNRLADMGYINRRKAV